MFLDANNHSLPDNTRKGNEALQEKVTRPGNKYVLYTAENTIQFALRRLRANLLFCC